MPQVKVTFTHMTVNNNGEPIGKKGELYWSFLVDGNVVSSRPRTNPLKVVDGETVQMNEAITVIKNAGQSLTVSGSVSEKDLRPNKDENASRSKAHMAPNWDLGEHNFNFRDGHLDVVAHYKIEM
jgi:hypothetical protein